MFLFLQHVYHLFHCHFTAQKTIFYFSKCSEKMVFLKRLHWNIIFLVLLGKMIFFREKMKDVFVKKIHENMTFYSNVLRRWSFQRNRTGTWSFLYYLERWYFFTWKYDIFSLGGKWKMIFLKKYMEIWYSLYICVNVTNMILLFYQKNQRRSPEKIHLKVIDILDWHSRKISNDPLYFHGDLHRYFHILLSSEKKRKLNI